MKYIIGLIDEEADQIATIRRTIKYNIPKDIARDDLDFKEYPLSGNGLELSHTLCDAIISDIVDNCIHCLIIDNRIIVDSALVEGATIYNRIRETVPKFPIIILTNVPGDCYEKTFVDADKVYWKSKFFQVKEEYSKDRTANIFTNMKNYIQQRSDLQTQLSENLVKLAGDDDSNQCLQDVLRLEYQLNDYYPQQLSRVEESLNVSDLQQAVSLLEEARGLLE